MTKSHRLVCNSQGSTIATVNPQFEEFPPPNNFWVCFRLRSTKYGVGSCMMGSDRGLPRLKSLGCGTYGDIRSLAILSTVTEHICLASRMVKCDLRKLHWSQQALEDKPRKCHPFTPWPISPYHAVVITNWPSPLAPYP